MANSKVKLTLTLVMIVMGWTHTLTAADEPIPIERQREIIENYLLVTGHRGPITSAAEVRGHDTIPLKCGTSQAADFVLNRNRLDKRLMVSLGVDTLGERPLGLPKYFISPKGHFRIHYSNSAGDTNAVFQPNNVDGNGVPIYVDSVAAIADRAWAFTIDTLGYPVPPSDSSYDPDGPQYDIYLTNLPAYFFGLTYLDSTQFDGPGTLRATSYMNLDNDYQQIPGYETRPLDAVRVTVAHEFFHSVQFGIDFSESEIIGPGDVRRYWMEMSAVWMEEQQYTNINDYYSYLPFFFNFPRTSIQQFKPIGDYHPYGSVVLPLYLSQKYGRDIIRDIWLKCGQFGAGPSFLQAADSSIALFSDGAKHWVDAFSEFTLWNFFTGARAAAAPTGIGYTERANYPIIPDSLDAVVNGVPTRIAVTQIVDNYQFPLNSQIYSRNKFRPEHNAAAFMRLSLINNLATRYWTPKVYQTPDSILDSLCVIKLVDSLVGTDTLGYVDSTGKGTSDLGSPFAKKLCPSPETVCVVRSGCNDTNLVQVDSVVTVTASTGIDLPNGLWELNVVYHYLPTIAADSYSVESFAIPNNVQAAVIIKNPHEFESVTLIWAPASTNAALYSPNSGLTIGFLMDEIFGYDSALANLAGAVLTPYPNPAVISQMAGAPLKFRFQVSTDAASIPVVWSNPHISLDIYNVAGERVRTLTSAAATSSRAGQYEARWDMKNESGKDVTSGVYIALARLYAGSSTADPVAEKKVKVLIVR